MRNQENSYIYIHIYHTKCHKNVEDEPAAKCWLECKLFDDFGEQFRNTL